jgi:hypothetical protein
MDGERGAVRASDHERELVVERLSRALRNGRITLAEYDERVTVAYAAVNRAELRRLTEDLPGSLW